MTIEDNEVTSNFGTLEDDNLIATTDKELVFGGAGNDTIAPDASAANLPQFDRLYGGSGNDTLLASQSDRLFGGEGNDTLDGSLGKGKL